jgi:hypothetical protein
VTIHSATGGGPECPINLIVVDRKGDAARYLMDDPRQPDGENLTLT